MNLLDYIVPLAYVAVIVGMRGSFFSSNKSLKDYLLGGRNIPWWAAAPTT